MKFLRSFLRRHLAGKPVVALPNVGCLLMLPLPLVTLSLNGLSIPFVLITMRAALFLSQTISVIKRSQWERIFFHSRLQLFPEESGVYRQNYVVVSVIVSDPHLILHLPSPPSKYFKTLPTEIAFVWLIRFCV